MANLLRSLRGTQTADRYTIDQYIADVSSMYSYGLSAPAGLRESYDRPTRPSEQYDTGFDRFVRTAYRRNGIVFACQMARLRVFCEAGFQFQRMRGGRPGDLFGTPDLAVLERPWPNGTTGEMRARMIQDADLSGNAFMRRTDPLARQDRLERLRPDWMAIVLGMNPDMLTPDLAGYAYFPDGPESKRRPVFLAPEEVAHWSPIPDPLAQYRGMTWLTPVIREIVGDSAATDHKIAFWDHAATPNLVFKMDPNLSEDAFLKFKAMVDNNHAGALNAWKNLYIGGATDVTVAGSNFRDMDLRAIQGAGETRIAAAAGVPPIVVGLSEGLDAATYSNYAQARRAFADGTMSDLWRTSADALSTLIRVPGDARLVSDTRHVRFLQEDRKDAAEIQQTQATTIATLVREGYTPDSVMAAVTAEDWTLLEHTGALSVQLIEPGSSNGDGGSQMAGGAPAPMMEDANG